jgi:rod shape-determining protein MreD
LTGRSFALVAAVFVVHEAILRGVRLVGVRPDLLLCLAIAGGIAGGAERGAVIGFFAGILGDLFLPTPLGLSALVYCVLGFAVGTLQETVLPSSPNFVPLTGMAASAVGVVGFAVVGTLLGSPAMLTTRLIEVVAVVSIVNAAASRPLTKLLAWSFGGGAVGNPPPSSPYAT